MRLTEGNVVAEFVLRNREATELVVAPDLELTANRIVHAQPVHGVPVPVLYGLLRVRVDRRMERGGWELR